MSETTYYQRNRETILNRAKDYYKNNKEVLREKAKNKYRELSEKEKKKVSKEKGKYGRNRYHNIIICLKKRNKKQKNIKKNIGKLKKSHNFWWNTLIL